MSDHSRGQDLPPATALRTNGNNTQTIVIPESPPQGGASHRSCGCAIAKRLNGEGGAATFSELQQSPKPKNQNPSYCRSTGDTQCVDAPASSACLRNRPQNKRQQRQNHRHSGHHFAQAEGKCPESPPPGGASHRSCGCAVAKRLHGRGGAGEAPGEFFHILSRGQHSPPTPEQSSKKQHRHSGIFRRGEAVTGNIRNLPRQRAATPPAPATALP